MQTRDEATFVLRLWSDGGVYRFQLENLRTHEKHGFLDVQELEVYLEERVAWKREKGDQS